MIEKWKKGLFDIIRCSCSCEIAAIEVFDNDVTDHTAYLCIFRNYEMGGLPWSARIRSCWRILKTGKPYGDQMCLESDQLRKLESLAREAAEIIEARKEEDNASRNRAGNPDPNQGTKQDSPDQPSKR